MEEQSSPLRDSLDTGYWTATATPSDSFPQLHQTELSIDSTINPTNEITPIHIHFDDDADNCESLSKEEPPSLLFQICTSTVTSLSTEPVTPLNQVVTDIRYPMPEGSEEVTKWLSLRLNEGLVF